MNKWFYYLLCLAWAAPHTHGGFFGPLEKGMSNAQVERVLGSWPGVKPPTQGQVFGAESEAATYFTTAKPYGAAICKVTPGFREEKLCALTLESSEGFPAEEYQGKFRSRYKQFAMMHQQRFGKPVAVLEWPKAAALKPYELHFIHFYPLADDMLVCVGIVKTGDDVFNVVARFVDKLLVPKLKEPDPKTLEYWAGVTEFHDLKEADAWILKAMTAIAAKKPKLAMEYFHNAAALDSPRGYWGLSYMYSGGKGVMGDKKLSEEYRDKAASMGYAMSAVEVDRNFNQAMKKLNVTASEIKDRLAAMHRAAAEGVMSDQYNLGVMYRNGYGLPKNAEKAKYYFRKAADQGDRQALAALESMD